MTNKPVFHTILAGKQTIAVADTGHTSTDGKESVSHDVPGLDYEEVAAALAGATDVVLTADETRALLKDHPRLTHQLSEWGVDDTELLEQLVNILATDLIGERWPTYGETEIDYSAFVSRVHAAAKSKGYEIQAD
ncbi:hypothetical protein [Pseudomonas savastanoi]|uniref:hypothetical protein n=1 Tax=Pseudomonas savastanoi TaxID=29438 RepID=UPI000EFE6E91|nr:hypothetical protein [Pseudomonas savastanoi]RMQ57460.1 hypothetical protein ALQ01_200058 [Pseudomonas savastanoi pv. glycinea]